MEGSGRGEGIDLPPIEPWLRERLPAARPPFRLTRLTGGHSNLTYALADAAGGEWVLRRPPLGPRQATAHDVLREGRIMAALASTVVPVPAILGAAPDLCPDGAPLLLMERAPGVAVGGGSDTALAPSARARCGLALAETLAALHAVDPAAVGLGDLGRGEGYVARQLGRWHRQWTAGRTRSLADLEVAHGLLVDRVPPQSRIAIVHGDFRLDNCLLDRTGEVTAVLDWEICTLGDPLCDLGLLLVYWAEPGDPVIALEDPPTLLPGFTVRTVLRRRYEATSALGADALTAPGDLDFYLAFAWWKLACIVEGVYARVERGALGTIDRPAASFAAQAERLAAAAVDSARRLSPGCAKQTRRRAHSPRR